MRKRIAMARSNDSGFTLVELLIVIVILGVLTGIVVFSVGAFNDRGKVAACQSDRKAVEVAVEAYRAKTGAYPAGLDSDARIGLLVPNYLRTAPGTTNYTITLADTGAVTGSIC